MPHLERPGEDNGFFSTTEVRSRSKPAESTSRKIALPTNHYQKPPNLAAGFKSLDISHEKPIRANVTAEISGTEDFSIAIETWGGSVLYSASTTWIEHKADARECVFGQFDTQDGSSDPAKVATAPKASKTRRNVVYTEPTPQEYNKPFSFPQPFNEPPEVVCWLNRLDLGSGRDKYCVSTETTDVSSDGFTAHLNAKDDSVLNGAGCCWIAFPRNKKHVDCGSFSTNDVRKAFDPRAKNSRKIKFRRKFDHKPTVLVALNMLNMAGNADLRVKIEITDCDREGFRWHLDTWGDSTLYAAGASWIALGFE